MYCFNFFSNVAVVFCGDGAGLQPGQLPAAGGVAPGGASLDFDDVAGEIDQDRGEGRAACAAGGVSDGGSGDPARVVPIHPTGY